MKLRSRSFIFIFQMSESWHKMKLRDRSFIFIFQMSLSWHGMKLRNRSFISLLVFPIGSLSIPSFGNHFLIFNILFYFSSICDSV